MRWHHTPEPHDSLPTSSKSSIFIHSPTRVIYRTLKRVDNFFFFQHIFNPKGGSFQRINSKIQILKFAASKEDLYIAVASSWMFRWRCTLVAPLVLLTCTRIMVRVFGQLLVFSQPTSLSRSGLSPRWPSPASREILMNSPAQCTDSANVKQDWLVFSTSDVSTTWGLKLDTGLYNILMNLVIYFFLNLRGKYPSLLWRRCWYWRPWRFLG